MAACVFCGIVEDPSRAAVVLEDGRLLAFLDHRPLFPGHVLLIPRAHYETLSDLPEELLAPLFGAARRLARACETGLGAEGAFVGLNNRVSQSVKHVHVHIVPRRRGDGLRGFFWPRRKYRDDLEMAEFAERLRRALGESPQ